MKNLYIFFGILFSFLSEAQNRNSIWCFGDSAGINWNNPQQPQFFKTAFKGRGSAVSIADNNGNLEFYAQTLYIPVWNLGGARAGAVFNKNHQVMHNGDSIVGRSWYNEMVIIPELSNNHTFYLFSIGVTGPDSGIYYSVIDMNLNNGLGAVTQKNICLYNVSLMCDGISALKHGNARDWWLICRPSGGIPNNYFLKYLIQPGSILGPFVQTIGNLNETNNAEIVFNSVGTKMIFQNLNGLIDYFDFDRCTGILSNHINIKPVNTSSPFPIVSSSISLNDSVLYISTDEVPPSLYQYNLTSTNILLTEQIISTLPAPVNGFALQGFLKLAPDGKVYWSSMFYDGSFFFPYPDTTYNIYNTNLSVINQPNNLGTSCDFQPFSFYLGGARTYYGLPNNPNYDLGPLTGSMCDTLTVGIHDEEQENSEIMVFPNPCINKFSLGFTGSNVPVIEKVVVINILGEIVKSFNYKNHQINVFDISELSRGLYILEVDTKYGMKACKLLKK